MSVCFLRRERKGIYSDGRGGGRDLGGVGGGKTINKIHCVKKYFNKKRKIFSFLFISKLIILGN